MFIVNVSLFYQLINYLHLKQTATRISSINKRLKMKNLIKAIETEQKTRINDFIFAINQLTELKQLDTWQYNDLLPKGKNVKSFTFEALKAYLIDRKQKSIYKAIEREVSKVKAIENAGTLLEVKISIEWKRSQMWGSNPKAECWATFKDKDGNTNSNYVVSGSIGGCGYDKQSTAVAECLNQINAVLKPLYSVKNKSIDSKNHELLGYGAGYGILPSIEGGVGVSCYPRIFEKIGFKFNTVASGKNYDVYTITKLTNQQ